VISPDYAPETCVNQYRFGTWVRLDAVPSPDSVFVGWTGACSGSLQTCQVMMNQAKSATALFRGPQPLAVTLESQEGGSGVVHISPPNAECTNAPGSPQTCTNQYRIGTVVHLAAEASADSVFIGWTAGACSGPLQTCQVTVDEARFATATFRLNHPPVAVAGGPYSARRNESIAFDGAGSSDADGDPLTYAWDFGDGATSTGPSPTHAYAALGTHTVTLIVHDGRISSAPSTAVVSITNAAPEAVVGGGPQTGVRGEVLTFHGSGSSDLDGDPLTYAWDFGDGSMATDATATHAYATLGAFTVTLVVSDGIDSSAPASTTANITNRAPVASAGGPYDGTHAGALAFDASSSSDPDGDPLTFAWTFGDGATGTGPSPSHTYAASGSYTVTVAVSDGVDTATSATTATISNVVPIARPGGPYTSFRNAPLMLDGTASTDGNGDPLTYRWDFGDGTTGTGATPTHAYIAFGSYVVSLVVNDGAADSPSAVALVTIPDRPPLAHAGGPYTGVRGVAITFNGAASADPDGNPLTYQWSFGDGATGTGMSPTHVYTTAGPFVARLVVSDGGPEPSLESTATVTLTNRLPIAQPGGPYAGVRALPVQLDGSASTDPDGDPLTYAWDFGDGNTGTGLSPAHIYTTLGTRIVTLTVNDGITSSTAVTTTVTITNASPIANAGPDRTVVRKTSVTLDGRGSSDPDGTISYAWRRLSGPSVTLIDPNSAQPRFTAPNVTSTKVIEFELKVTDNNGATAIDTVRITVIR
jgi:PKD repeat protein